MPLADPQEFGNELTHTGWPGFDIGERPQNLDRRDTDAYGEAAVDQPLTPTPRKASRKAVTDKLLNNVIGQCESAGERKDASDQTQ